jgi:hypothetical protein
VDLSFAHASVCHNLFNWLHGLSEERHAELLELGARDSCTEVFSLSERLTEDF